METTLARTTDLSVLDRPADRMLSWSLVVAPLVYLLADCLYTANGWDNGDAGAVHVIGAVSYGFVAIRFFAWSRGRLQIASLVAAIVGTAGNVAYGFDTIHVSLGATALVDTDGPGAIIKPLGLFFPVVLLLGAVVLRERRTVRSAALTGVAAVLWPVAHIANIGGLAIVTNLLLVAALVPLGIRPDRPFGTR